MSEHQSKIKNPRRYERAMEALVRHGDVSQERVDTALAAVDSAWDLAGELYESPLFDSTRNAIAEVSEAVVKQNLTTEATDKDCLTVEPLQKMQQIEHPQPVRNSYTLPEGYVLVPLTPTDAQIRAAWDVDASDRQRNAAIVYAAMIAAAPAAKTFQQRVQPWMLECFGAEISADREERNHRFAEEAMELVQANGMPRADAHALVDYVYNRPAGELTQEVGGVMVTLAALCLASGADMHANGETELARISNPETVAKIRAKQAAKPRGSALPVATADARDADTEDARRYRWLRDNCNASATCVLCMRREPEEWAAEIDRAMGAKDGA